MRAITPLHLLMTAFICLLFMAPVTAQDNPYQNAGTVTEYDIPIALDSTDTITNSAFDSLMAGSSENEPKAIGSDIVAFNGAGYSYRIGRVTITMNPLDMKSGESARIKGNTRSYGSDPVFEHEVYRDLIKERVILNSPRTLQYVYNLKLSDWVTREPDMSQPVEVRGADGTISVTYPHIKEVTTLAADSTIDINPDPWGNLEVSVNDESVVVMPKPFAIDADGKRFELAYLLDKEAGTITITGDLTDAKYPVTIDPTERVTNGGFETGDTTGWWKSDAPELIVFSSEPYQGSYYCRYTGNGLSGFAGYTRMYQTIDYTGVPLVFGAVKIRSPNPYNFYLSDGYWDETANYSITFPKTPATGWVLKNATTNRSSTGKIAIWTHGSSSADIDSIRAIGFNTPVVQFTGSPASGTAPLTVYFTDQSTNSPTSWSWNFGDGGTSTAQHPSHTYTLSGTYTVRLTASNAEGTGDPSTKTNYISVSAPLPNAQFTASPTTGTAPLTVYFTDQSTNSPTSWSWNFGDGGTSTAQHPSHIYTSSGTYTVSLTVANAAGSDSEVKVGFVTVTSNTVNYHVFADGVRYYHNFENNSDVAGADTTSQYFYAHLTDSSRCHDYAGTTYCWNARNNPVNDDTGSVYWRQSESADTVGANSAEFVFHAGHGWEDGILFGTANSVHKVYRSDMSFSRAKWVALDSCSVLNQSTQSNWESVFDGLHILMGFDTTGLVNENTGPQFIERMRGGTYQGTTYLVRNIRDSWRLTMQNTLQESSLRGAYMWADPSGDDYLPGYGPFEEPTTTNGEYTIHWDNFQCI